MKDVWSEESRLACWLEVELAALDAWAEIGAVPIEAAAEARRLAVPPTPERVAEIEERTQHDLAAFVISNLDENGYLLNHDPDRRTPIPIAFEELARNFETAAGRPVTLAEVEEALFVVHKLEPAGVGARDTKECLLLQVDEDTEHAELVRLLILHHLEDVAHNRLLSQHYRRRHEWYCQMLDELPRLNAELRERMPALFEPELAAV